MSNIRPEISSKNRYYISKHRYYELLHFCMQYEEWAHDYADTMSGCVPMNNIYDEKVQTSNTNDRTAELAMIAEDLSHKMDLVFDTCKEADPVIANYIFKAVTEGRSFANLQTVFNIPCGKDMFYDRYRKFFWLLSKKR